MYDSADVIETGQTMKLENQELRKEIVAVKKERDLLKRQLTTLEMEYLYALNFKYAELASQSI